MSQSKRVTIDDIAAAAGVSKTTVSRYLNGHRELMKDRTWERIKAVIEMSNYRPSDIASNLKKRTTNLIGVSIADITSPFSSALIVGISKLFDERGYTLLIANSGDSPEKERMNISSLISKGVSGLLVNTSACDNDFLVQTACCGIPIVLCDRKVRNHTFDVVTSNHEEGMLELIKHIKGQGYTRPILFTQKWEQNSTRIRRRESYIRGVEKTYGYSPLDAGDIYLIDHSEGTSTVLQMERLLKSLKAGDVPAVIGTNSITTARVYHAISEMGLSVPDKIGLCGPEDWDWSNELNWPFMIRPHVTTLKVPSTEIGYIAAARLLRKMQEPDLQPEEILVPCELNVRKSTKRYE